MARGKGVQAVPRNAGEGVLPSEAGVVGWHAELVPGVLRHEHEDTPGESNAGSVVQHDAVNHPRHYTAHPSGIECITITEHMGFNLGNAVKYIWRADLKDDALEDLRKAAWYLDREIARRTKAAN